MPVKINPQLLPLRGTRWAPRGWWGGTALEGAGCCGSAQSEPGVTSRMLRMLVAIWGENQTRSLATNSLSRARPGWMVLVSSQAPHAFSTLPQASSLTPTLLFSDSLLTSTISLSLFWVLTPFSACHHTLPRTTALTVIQHKLDTVVCRASRSFIIFHLASQVRCPRELSTLAASPQLLTRMPARPHRGRQTKT